MILKMSENINIWRGIVHCRPWRLEQELSETNSEMKSVNDVLVRLALATAAAFVPSHTPNKQINYD